MIQITNKGHFKEAITEIAKTFEQDDDWKKKKKESVIDENQIETKAKKILRIGGRWFKKATDPVTHQETLFDITPKMVIDDEGKEIGNLILKVAPKYLAKTNIPSHLDYHESIDNGDGELFYNIYKPLPHSPAEGEWQHIEMLLRHIFQEQYEMGLDYLKVLYERPLHPLPVLLLVSDETGTGKSTFPVRRKCPASYSRDCGITIQQLLDRKIDWLHRRTGR